MTPPGEYEDGSVGVPLPGMRTRLTEQGELEIAGPYVGGLPRRAAGPPGEEHWLPTGDVFVRRPSGHFEIVDRVKDVYKNTRGQTVAPAAVERRLADVPGVKRAFLVGDGRDHNVLLIVPDRADPVIAGATPEAEDAYFGQIVAAVNRDVAPSERVVGFALLDRDFEPGAGADPEGLPSAARRSSAPSRRSSSRSTARTRSRSPAGGSACACPAGCTGTSASWRQDVVAAPRGPASTGARGACSWSRPRRAGASASATWRTASTGDVVDLGLFARQPMLWAGNPSLRAFAPCKDGWDVPLGRVAPQRPGRRGGDGPPGATRRRCDAGAGAWARGGARRWPRARCFGRGAEALAAVEGWPSSCPTPSRGSAGCCAAGSRSLAWHADLEVRCLAYRTLLLDEPLLGSGDMLRVLRRWPAGPSSPPRASTRSRGRGPSATASRRCACGCAAIVATSRGRRRGGAGGVRGRLRAALDGAARARPEHLVPVRAELATWALFEADPALAAARAAPTSSRSAEWCRSRVTARRGPGRDPRADSPDEERALSRGARRRELPRRSRWRSRSTSPRRARVEVAPGGAWVGACPPRHEAPPLPRQLRDGGRPPPRPAARAARRRRRAGRRGDDAVDDRARRPAGRARDRAALRVRARRPRRALDGLPQRPEPLGARARLGGADVGEAEAARGVAEPLRARASPPSSRAGGRATGGSCPATSCRRTWRCRAPTTWPTSASCRSPAGGRTTGRSRWWRRCGATSSSRPSGTTRRCAAGWTRRGSTTRRSRGSASTGPARSWPSWRGDGRPAGRPGATRRLPRVSRRVLLRAARAAAAPSRGTRSGSARTRRRRPRRGGSSRARCTASTGSKRTARSPATTSTAALTSTTRRRRSAGRFDRLLERLFERRGEPATRLVELSELQSALGSAEDRRALGELVFPRSESLQDAELRSAPGAARAFVLSHVDDGRGARFAVREPIGPAEVGRLVPAAVRVGPRRGRELAPARAARRGGAGGRRDHLAARRPARRPPRGHRGRAGAALAAAGRSPARGLLRAPRQRRLRRVHTHFGPGPFPFAPGFGVDRRWGGLVRFLAPVDEAVS